MGREIKPKRSLIDWSTDELLEFLEASKEASDQDCSEPDGDERRFSEVRRSESLVQGRVVATVGECENAPTTGSNPAASGAAGPT